MTLLSLRLTNFKNYEAQSLDLSPRLNCFTGLNGMGKTNVLDAVHFLCLSRSHTMLTDKQLMRHGETFFRLEGLFEQGDERTKLVVKLGNGHRKEIERNGVAFQRIADFVGLFPVVMIGSYFAFMTESDWQWLAARGRRLSRRFDAWTQPFRSLKPIEKEGAE